MERGTILLTSLEMSAVAELLTQYHPEKQALITKIAPVVSDSQNSAHTITISEEEAEVILDSMPIPGKESNNNLNQARKKLQQFLANLRFSEK
jgi:hypothetical protein